MYHSPIKSEYPAHCKYPSYSLSLSVYYLSNHPAGYANRFQLGRVKQCLTYSILYTRYIHSFIVRSLSNPPPRSLEAINQNKTTTNPQVTLAHLTWPRHPSTSPQHPDQHWPSTPSPHPKTPPSSKSPPAPYKPPKPPPQPSTPHPDAPN